MLPLGIRRRAQAAREAARSLAKQSTQQHVRSIARLVAEAEAGSTRCGTPYGRHCHAAGPSSQGGRPGLCICRRARSSRRRQRLARRSKLLRLNQLSTQR
jgi:hypothetical protein